ncbi:hypothetical protein CERSUDRAFT_117094 [Gelatoporia subvermispora B]|uniref:Uncharacterized protein n=1 Tax=Ceriporiopsis subvermispora (strain B) TaxID=914234 RepID=M2QPU2_CERS8|nr:hypothetical protein CERSUDRAFT_117094 [Gelatoporia subvermispora B]
MSSMVFYGTRLDETLSSSKQMVRAVEAAVQACPRAVTLFIRFGFYLVQSYIATVVYTPRSEGTVVDEACIQCRQHHTHCEGTEKFSMLSVVFYSPFFQW